VLVVVCSVLYSLLERFVMEGIVRVAVGCGEEKELDALTSDNVQVVG